MSAELLGLPEAFEFRGKRYLVAYRDLFIEIAFADWCAADAGLTLARLRPHLPADFYSEQARLYNSKLCGKQFRWGSEDVFNASWSDEGIRQLLHLKMMRGAEKGGARLERELLDEIAKDKEKYAELQAIMQRQDYADFFDPAKKEAKTESLNEQSVPPLDNPPQPPPLPPLDSTPTV